MKYAIKCPFCNQQYELDEFIEGQEAECENCHRSFTICMSILDVSVGQHPHNNNETTKDQKQKNDIKTISSVKVDVPNVNSVENNRENIDKTNSKEEMQKQDSDEKHNNNSLADWQKSIKPNQMNKSDLDYFNSINQVINIWDSLANVLYNLFWISILSLFIYIMILMATEKISLIGIICAIGVPCDLLFNWLICKSAKAVLESFRAMNYNAKIISTSIVNLKESTNNK